MEFLSRRIRPWPEFPSSGSSVLFLVAFQIAPVGHLRAQVPGTARHEHLTEVACVDVPPGEMRPDLAASTSACNRTSFQSTIRLLASRAFPSRKAAEAAKSATGILVEEDGRVWLSEFGAQDNPRTREAKRSPASGH